MRTIQADQEKYARFLDFVSASKAQKPPQTFPWLLEPSTAFEGTSQEHRGCQLVLQSAKTHLTTAILQ